MDTAVVLVQAYLHVNGYFTVAEHPVLETMRSGQLRTVIDLDILASQAPGLETEGPCCMRYLGCHGGRRRDPFRRNQPVRVELLYFDGCPNWTVAEERLHEALRSVDREGVHVAKVRVSSPQEAEELGFIGSPTIRFDGVDPFASGGELVGLACRVYATPDGLGGSPTTAQLVHVLA
jgi:hypothetical protein